jgi:hypothetical protein
VAVVVAVSTREVSVVDLAVHIFLPNKSEVGVLVLGMAQVLVDLALEAALAEVLVAEAVLVDLAYLVVVVLVEEEWALVALVPPSTTPSLPSISR